MKRIVYPVCMLAVLIIFSCKKDHFNGSKQIVIDTTLASGTDYYLDLSQYGDRDDTASITKQALNYTISEISNATPGNFNSVYHYSVFAKTPLTDQVVLSVKEGARGNQQAHKGDSTVITINFTVQ